MIRSLGFHWFYWAKVTWQHWLSVQGWRILVMFFDVILNEAMAAVKNGDGKRREIVTGIIL